MRAISAIILFVSFIAATHGSGLKILGGYVDVYTEDSSSHLGRQYEWGSTSLTGATALAVGENYCLWTVGGFDGYCKQYIVVSTQNNPTQIYYQILGSYQRVYDRHGSVPDSGTPIRHQYGSLSTSGPNKYQFVVNSGQSWAPGHGQWGYAYLYFVVQRTISQPLTNAFSFRQKQGGAEANMLTEYFVPSGGWPEADRNTISQFRCWSSPWGQHTNCYQYLWRD